MCKRWDFFQNSKHPISSLLNTIILSCVRDVRINKYKAIWDSILKKSCKTKSWKYSILLVCFLLQGQHVRYEHLCMNTCGHFHYDALWMSITMTGLTVFNNLISILPVYGLVSHFTLNAKQWLIAEQNREDTSSLEWNMNYRPLRFNSVCLLSCSKEFQTNYFQKCCQL